MSQESFLILFTFSLFLIAAFISTTVKKRKKETHDYYAVFIMGLVWVIFSILIKNPPLGLMGTLFATVGLMHKKEWRARRNWTGLSNKEKIFKSIFISLTIVLGILTWWLFHSFLK